MVPVNLLDMFQGGNGRIPGWKVATEIVAEQTFGARRGYGAVRRGLRFKFQKTLPGQSGRGNASV